MELNEHPDEPLFRELRRRHPDVDLVLLPGETPHPEPGTEADETAAEQLTAVRTRARQLWRAIAPDGSDGPEARFRYGADASSVRPFASLMTRRDDGYEVLIRLRHELETDGWAVHRPDGTIERLAGRLAEREVSASYAEALGVLVFSMSGPSVTVGQARARELTASGRRG